ncbi:MAG TPA: HEAT repeat domain-containing protein [Planctomycetota bacterium]|nr:HEAT repeat domain-containing protein [Planctomycetota bacterium]
MPITDPRFALVMLAAISPAFAEGIAVSQSGGPSRARTPDAAIREVLAGSTKDPARPVDACIGELASAGHKLIPNLVDVLASGELPGGTQGETIDARQEEIVLGALERFRRGDLKGRVEALLDAQARPAARRGGYRLLGAVGDREDLSLLCRALRPSDPDADPDREEAACFRAAVAGILKRDELGYPLVRALLRGEPAPIRYYLIDALAETGSSAALELLGSEPGTGPEEGVSRMTACARLAASVELPVDATIPSWIRVHLRSEDPMEVSAAAECLGRIEDYESVSELTELLGHPHPDVGRAALQALRTITGANLRPDAARWRSWVLAEEEWFAGSSDRIAADLAGSSPVKKMAAIAELAGHPFHRCEAARLLARALPHETDELQRVGCVALRQLRASSALPFLEACAESRSKAVADEARAAIETIRAARP